MISDGVPKLPAGTVSGVGSMPGIDPFEAMRIIVGELGLPHLPETPARGPGAALVGRAAAILVDFPLELSAGRWRAANRPGVDQRRAREFLSADFDAAAGLLGAASGPVKAAAPGPWTLLATLEDSRGRPLLADAGARRELIDSLRDGTEALLARMALALPYAQPWLQLDEPSLPAVLAGRIRTASGFGALAPVTAADAAAALRTVSATAPTLVHCCAPDLVIDVLSDAGVMAVSAPIAALAAHEDAVGAWLESGRLLFAGVVDPMVHPPSDPAATVAPVRQLLSRIGIPGDRAVASIVLTPDCGLAGTPPGQVVPLLTAVRAAAAVFADDPEWIP